MWYEVCRAHLTLQWFSRELPLAYCIHNMHTVVLCKQFEYTHCSCVKIRYSCITLQCTADLRVINLCFHEFVVPASNHIYWHTPDSIWSPLINLIHSSSSDADASRKTKPKRNDSCTVHQSHQTPQKMCILFAGDTVEPPTYTVFHGYRAQVSLCTRFLKLVLPERRSEFIPSSGKHFPLHPFSWNCRESRFVSHWVKCGARSSITVAGLVYVARAFFLGTAWTAVRVSV